MIKCPNCFMENSLEAEICSNCSAQLKSAPSINYHQDRMSPAIPVTPGNSQLEGAQEPRASKLNDVYNETQHLQPNQNFLPRLPGSIFGDKYLCNCLIVSTPQRHTYRVERLANKEGLILMTCPNPECNAVFPSLVGAPDRFCTDCGTVLRIGDPDLILVETREPISEKLEASIVKKLSHGSVRAPIAAFREQVEQDFRHCMVMPQVQRLPMIEEIVSIDKHQVLSWGLSLARGLDYLNENGVYFARMINSDLIGIDNGKAVWVDFENVQHISEGSETESLADVQALAKMIYFWMTGKAYGDSDSESLQSPFGEFNKLFNPLNVQNTADLVGELGRMQDELGTSKKSKFHSGFKSDAGNIRDKNEDSLLVIEVHKDNNSVGSSSGVFVIADGMGGHADGEIASGKVIEIISQAAYREILPTLMAAQEIDINSWLVSAVHNANRTVFDLRNAAGTDMGSTVVVSVLIGNLAFIAHVGDSRAYLLNRNRIRQLTNDHSLVQQMVVSNQISREEARRHPQRNVIYRTIGGKTSTEPDVNKQQLECGDYLLLCSDGLTGMLDDETIHHIVMDCDSPQSACDTLIDSAKNAGGEDNISVILIGLEFV